MQSLKVSLSLVIAAVVTACATPIEQASGSMTSYDRDTEYSVIPRQDGFTLVINYGRYQFIPESSAVATACKSTLTSLAHELAERQARKIRPLDEQRIRLSFGRNGLTGVTSCSASAVAEWSQ